MFRSPSSPSLLWRSLYGARQISVFAAIVLCLLVAVGGVVAYQVQTASTGTGPVVKTFPSTLTATHSFTSNVRAFTPSAQLNAVGAPLTTYFTPQIALTTNSIDTDVLATGCVNTTFRCSNRGNITIAFNKPVTNPVLHISGLGGNTGTTASQYHASLNLTSWVATGTPTLTRVSGNTNFSVVGGTEIRSPTINGGTSCQAATPAGCGSVRINGTVTSVTFRVDMLMGGTGANPAGTASDGFAYTVTVDEDFGDAPAGFQPSPVASHVVSGVFMGGSITADNTATVNGNPQNTSPIATATANLDGGDDGVTFPVLTRGQASQIAVAVTGAGGRLQGWIDWGGDGSWNTGGDRIATNAIDGGAGDADGTANGIIQLNVTPPTGTTQATVNARFRYSTTSSLNFSGAASDGEVEDYQVIVYPQRNDLSLTKTVSNPSPAPGSAISYTLTLASAAQSATSNTATTVTVQDTLPAGFTFTGATGTGSYDSGTGVWTVGSLAPGQNAQLVINGTAINTPAATVTNIAQVRSSTITDPDSTPNNTVTTEDDYATVSFTTSAVYNCPMGSTATGSGFANGGTGLFQEQIFWLDWNCGGTTSFPVGSIVNKSWDAGDGLVITGQVTNIANAPVTAYSTGGWTGDILDNMYPGVNPIGLGGAGGLDPNFRVTYTAALNGIAVPMRYAVADAEQTDAGAETMTVSTTGSAWRLVEKQGGIVETLSGSNASWTGGGGSSSVILETTGTTVQLDASIINNGGQFFAFGIFTPFDFSDAPLTGTSYGVANHRTIGNYILGASVTSEAAAYDSPNATGDVDNAIITMPGFLRGAPATVNVAVQGLGRLSGWLDFNDDGDFADAGEKIATDLVDGGAGDLDGAVNGVIQFTVTPPATAATTPTFLRLRYSSRANAPSSGLWGFGEVEDYQVTIANAELTLFKSSMVVSDLVNETTNPKRIPGATVRYCILVTNVGTVAAENVEAIDDIPPGVVINPATIRTGTSCAAASQIEDVDNTGADENNPFGASLAGAQLIGTAPSLAVGGSFAIVFDSVVQ